MTSLRYRLQQIFTNLLGNAVKFTPEGGEIIVRGQVNKSVYLHNYAAEGETDRRKGKEHKEDGMHHLLFSVQDNGVGVPPEKEDRLFQLFSQCDASTTRLYGGSGLGLAISKVCTSLLLHHSHVYVFPYRDWLK